jgi:stalled ribosome rescue protein Dom34
MHQVHAIVWLDHREARIVGFSLDATSRIEVHSERPVRRVHHKANVIGTGRAPDDHHFFDGIVDAIDDTEKILVSGPGTAKNAFATYTRDRHPLVADRIVGIEPLDHPSDKELLAYAKKYFKAVDQLDPD